MSDKLLSFDADGVQFAWDATSISAYEKCPRYYNLRYLQGWAPNGNSVHLKFGGHYATALENYFKHIAVGHDEETALRKVVHQALIDTWERESPEDEGRPWESLHNTKTRETLIRSIIWYFEHFKDDPAPTLFLEDGTPAVELSFALPQDDDIIFCGHIDRMVEFDGYFVMDQKTSGSTISANFFKGFSPDVQMSMYSWAGSIMFHLPIKGVIIDAVQIAVGFSRYERGFVHRSKPCLEEWYDMTMLTIEDARRATANQEFRMNRASCGNYGGCEFRGICSRSPEHQPNLLAADFHKGERWDPLKRR